MPVVLRAAVAHWLLLFAVRIVGRRTASQMAPFDLVVLFLFAGSTITAVLGDDRSMVAAVSAVFTIGLMHVVASELKTRFDWFGRLIDGTPVVVFERGEFNESRMRRLRLTRQDGDGGGAAAGAATAGTGALRGRRAGRQGVHRRARRTLMTWGERRR